VKKVLQKTAKSLANVIYTAAVAGAGTASHLGIYQSKTPKSLLR